MINYGYILKQKEKDNPSAFLRATYLFSNVGDLVKCYGRSIRFPQDAKLYQAEMKLALGDIIMQCMMIRYEKKIKHGLYVVDDVVDVSTNIQTELSILARNTSMILQNKNTAENTIPILLSCKLICISYNWNFDEISHLGFIHVCERFEQFTREGWE